MKTLNTIIAGGLMVCATSVSAGITMNVSLATDYIFRGISQTGGAPAVQGGIDADLAIPFAPNHTVYAGFWGSSINFGEGIEYDTYAGAHGPFISKDVVNYDFHIIYYNYAQQNDLDFIEGHFGLNRDFGPLNLGASVNFTSDWFDSAGEAWYYSYDANLSLPYGMNLLVHHGHQEIADEERIFNGSEQQGGLAPPAGSDPAAGYTDTRVGISGELLDLTLDFSFYDNNISKATNCTDVACDRAQWVFSVSKEM